MNPCCDKRKGEAPNEGMNDSDHTQHINNYLAKFMNMIGQRNYSEAKDQKQFSLKFSAKFSMYN